MFTDIFKKYTNILIILLYVFTLYIYDFKDNIQLLLVVTGIFIYLIYNNKKDIIEGQEDMEEPSTGGDETPSVDTGAAETGSDETPSVDTGAVDTGAVDTGAVDTGAVDTGAVDTGGDLRVVEQGTLERLRETIRSLEGEIDSLDEAGNVDNAKLNELLNLYLEIYPNLQLDLPNSDGTVEDPSLNLNIDLSDINIPEDLLDSYNENELPKLKKRILDLEKKVKELDEGDYLDEIKDKILDLEIENDKWNEKSIEETKGKDGEKVLRQRKGRSFSNYKTTTPMGMYDGLCLDHLKKENIYTIADESEVNTFLGTTIPLNIKKADNTKLTGPSVDGNDNSPQRLNMFETNNTSISCCEDSPYLSSNGCVCLTSDQEDYLVNRGGNHD